MDDQLRESLEKLEVPKLIIWVDKEMKVETTNLTKKTVNEILALVTSATAEALEASEIEHVKFLEELEVETAQKLVEGQHTGVAWAIGMIDDMHFSAEGKAALKALIHQAEVAARIDELNKVMSESHPENWTDKAVFTRRYFNDRIHQLSNSQEEYDEPIEFPKGHKYHREESDD